MQVPIISTGLNSTKSQNTRHNTMNASESTLPKYYVTSNSCLLSASSRAFSFLLLDTGFRTGSRHVESTSNQPPCHPSPHQVGTQRPSRFDAIRRPPSPFPLCVCPVHPPLRRLRLHVPHSATHSSLQVEARNPYQCLLPVAQHHLIGNKLCGIARHSSIGMSAARERLDSQMVCMVVWVWP